MKKLSFSERLWNKTGLSFWCDWFQFRWKEYNWITFQFIHFTIEWDKIGNEFDVELALLGFGMRWQYSLNRFFKTEQNEKLMEQVKDMEKRLKVKSTK